MPNKADASLPRDAASPEVDRLARTIAGEPLASAETERAGWDSLGVTRVIDPGTDSPDLTPPPGFRVPVNKPAVGGTLGEFELLEKLGEGAMGAVYRARQASFNRIVALKVLFGHIASQPRLVERLYREARAMAQLDHPNIVQAHGFGEVGGCHYVAMEFVDGKNLQIWLRRLSRLSVPDALAVALAIARGLEHAHARGVVHRDIKPENILISPAGEIKVADLGMVKTEDDDMALTMTGHAIGTPWYMPLEQAKNAKLTDARSDIYSLGCLLYCLLTGRPPFQGKTLVDVIQAKERGSFATARSQNADVPERLDLILVKMLAKSPAQRYQSCTEAIADLEKLGLAATRLSFLRPAPDVAQFDTPTPIVSKTVIDNPSFDPNVWYVRIPTEAGKYSLRKLKTEELRTALKSGLLQRTVLASHYSKQGFRALSTYKEFAARGTRIDEASANKYQELYREMEKVEDSRDRSADRIPVPHSSARYYFETIWFVAKYPLLVAAVAALGWWLVNSR